MKKILSVLSLIAILGLTSPAFAAPHGPGGPGGPGGHGKGHKIHAGAHHRPHIAPRHHHHGGIMIHTGYPRHSYWHGYRYGYWNDPWCDYRLGWCDSYYRPIRHLGGLGVSIRF